MLSTRLTFAATWLRLSHAGGVLAGAPMPERLRANAFDRSPLLPPRHARRARGSSANPRSFARVGPEIPKPKQYQGEGHADP